MIPFQSSDSSEAGEGLVSFFENDWLDQYQVDFGEWLDQSVDWIDNNMEWMLATIKWPFTTMLDFLLDDVLLSAPWWAVALAMFAIGWVVRSFRVGAFALVALAFCGILGPNYWAATASTIGFITVAVVLCVIIGIPVGILCGRIDPVWSVVRPILDAMQVVHSFVYMLPFVFFFGIGEVSATMVTMVFALPPLIRLTNLGIRQVPEDVVEASRAYGAPEIRVLTDVQIPLARPAIMTGVNQTLLLAISMLGIAAIMGAGGLGRLMFQAINSQRVSQGVAAGLAFFLVAVVLDRISQPDDGQSSGSLFSRTRAAWANWRTPEELLRSDDADADESGPAGTPAVMAPREKLGMLIAGAGAVLGLIALALPWAHDAGFATSHSRAGDADLEGSSFNGIEANGGSFWGLLLLFAAVFVIVSAVARRTRPSAARFLSADGIVIVAFLALGSTVAYLLGSPAPAPVVENGAIVDWVTNFSRGAGAYLGVLAAVIMAGGGWLSLSDAPYAPHRPVTPLPEWYKLFGLATAVVLVVIGSISGWSFDTREDVVLSADAQAEIQRLRDEVAANPDDNAVAIINSQQIQTIVNSARSEEVRVRDGWTDLGAKMGLPSLIFGIAGAIAALFATGIIAGGEQHKKWRWSAITVGLGAGTAAVGAAWIFAVSRATDPAFLTGVGAFLVLLGGFSLIALGRGLVTEFFRVEVFHDELLEAPPEDADSSEAVAEAEPALLAD